MTVAHTTVDRRISKRLRAARLAAHLSVAELAEQVSLSSDCLTAIERGDKRIDARLMSKISIALGIEVFWFFDNSPCHSRIRVPAETSADVNVLLSNLMAHASPALKALMASANHVE